MARRHHPSSASNNPRPTNPGQRIRYPRAHKNLGQNFLPDPSYNTRIAQTLTTWSTGTVLEIGAGTGALTTALCEHHTTNIVIIEPDDRMWSWLLPLLHLQSNRHHRRVIALNLRAQHVDLHLFTPPLCLYGNLPFHVASHLLTLWLTWPDPPWTDMVLMFQREVAQRLIAPVGSSSYGRLSILTSLFSVASLGLTIPSQSFRPTPKVDGQIVHLKRRDLATCEALPTLSELTTLETITRQAFNQRRKTLINSLKMLMDWPRDRTERWLEHHGIDPRTRAQNVCPQQYLNLARSLSHTDQAP